MKQLITKILSPIISLFCFSLGGGLLTTLLVLMLHNKHESSISIGIITSLFYLGLVLGSFKIEKLIVRIGHIRTFANFGAILTASILIHLFEYNFYIWCILRLITGFSTAGLFIVIESWLLTLGDTKNRGQILAIYMVALYLANSLSQLFLKIDSLNYNQLFIMIGISAVLSIIPLSLTKSQSPIIEETSALSLKKIYLLTKTGVAGCFCAGLIMSSIYGFLPLFLIKISNDDFVATGMALVIFGGMFWQYPIGKISDLIERRKIILFLCIAGIIISLLINIFNNYTLLCSLIFILGGVTFTLYPISISHACDSLNSEDIISGTQALLLAYSLGAVIGPLITPIFIKLLGIYGLFYYIITTLILLCSYMFWRQSATKYMEPEEPFVTVTTTSPLIATMDPRGAEE